MLKNSPKVLYNLQLAHSSYGFSGIPQDSRLLLKTLSGSEAIEVSGLLMPGSHKFPYGKLNDIGTQSSFLAEGFERGENDRSLIEKVLSLAPILGRSYRLGFRAQMHKVQMEPLRKDLNDIVWRQFFSMTLESESKEAVTNLNYWLTNLGSDRSALSSIYSFPKPSLKTEGFDFFVSQDSLSVKLSPGTRHVVRYHDGLPILAADTTPEGSPRLHMGSLKNAVHDSLYVCNTPSALNDLSILQPRLAENAVVIPYSLPVLSKPKGDYKKELSNIFIARRSAFSKKLDSNLAKVGYSGRPFILSLSTLEPRKNFGFLIDAWQKLQMNSSAEIDLVIVGKPGWKYESIFKQMTPHIIRGNLHHLEGVGQDELPALYSAATAFVFPSFAEGFGLPPVEAMGCEVPVLMSDIPAHRFSGGDAAKYFNPYEVEGLVGLLQEVTTNERLRIEMVAKGLKNANRFTDDVNLPLWEKFFHDNLKVGKK